ncbi:hypothetical protein BKA63DRAFT_460863 [Paraphoma chrysanthemicola]|nr:hypothetical protein BKA63DRAFT_460863 [Paraphoma chrysanthemicola]
MTEPKSRTHGEPGPNWRALLSYYSGPSATEGLMNLQDLYLYVTHVGIPNAVIDNRRLLLHFYLNKPRAPVAIKLRYDRWPGTCEPQQEVYIPPTSAPQASPPNTVPVHSIFRDYPTPSGASFAQWLHNPMNVPPGTVLLVQMQHRGSVLDGYLNEDEVAVRQIAGPALIDRTVRVLKLYWWLWMANRWLVEYQDGGWAGMEREVL